MSDDFLYRFRTPVSSCQGSVVTHLLHVIPHGHQSLVSVMCNRSQYQKVYQCMGSLLCMRIHGGHSFCCRFSLHTLFLYRPVTVFPTTVLSIPVFQNAGGGTIATLQLPEIFDSKAMVQFSIK